MPEFHNPARGTLKSDIETTVFAATSYLAIGGRIFHIVTHILKLVYVYALYSGRKQPLKYFIVPVQLAEDLQSGAFSRIMDTVVMLTPAKVGAIYLVRPSIYDFISAFQADMRSIRLILVSHSFSFC